MLLNILLIVIMLAGVWYGWYLMSHVDGFIEKEKKAQAKEQLYAGHPCAILFGRYRQTVEAGEWLIRQEIEPIYMEEIAFHQDWENVRYVIALSESDTDNLSVCNLVRKMYYTDQIYSVCNEKENTAVYKRFHVNVLEKTQRIGIQLEGTLLRKEVGTA